MSTPATVNRPDTADDALCHLRASEALRLFRARELSPVELLMALQRRIERLNPPINALRSVRWDAAFAAARKAEQRYARCEATGALEGVPILLKNEHDLVGEETDAGSLLLAGTVDTQNAPITQRVLDAGAVIHGRTHVPEFYIANFTRSVAHGVTRNPYRLDITCGGSSGGSGAALAAGFAPLSTASDIGGSARVPAAYCAVVGLKPSYGRVPEADFRFATNSFNQNGLMGRSVADAALMFNVINGPHPADPSTVRPKLELAVPRGDLRGMRVAVSEDLDYFDVAPEIRSATMRAADMLRDAGAQVQPVSLGWTRSAGVAYTNALVFALAHGLADAVRSAPTVQFSDYVLSIAAMDGQIRADDYLAATDTMAVMHGQLQAVFAEHDALLCPTLARNDLRAEGLAAAHEPFLESAMTYPFNMLGRHPVLAVPAAIGSSGVPIGVQIVAPTFREDVVMEVGAALEARVNWLNWRPGFTSGPPAGAG